MKRISLCIALLTVLSSGEIFAYVNNDVLFGLETGKFALGDSSNDVFFKKVRWDYQSETGFFDFSLAPFQRELDASFDFGAQSGEGRFDFGFGYKYIFIGAGTYIFNVAKDVADDTDSFGAGTPGLLGFPTALIGRIYIGGDSHKLKLTLTYLGAGVNNFEINKFDEISQGLFKLVELNYVYSGLDAIAVGISGYYCDLEAKGTTSIFSDDEEIYKKSFYGFGAFIGF